MFRCRFALVGCVVLWLVGMLTAQPIVIPPPPPLPVEELPPAKDAVAARVNGQAILARAIYRGTIMVELENRAARRKELLNFHIDNAIVDQYLIKLKIQVDSKDVQEQIDRMKAEEAKENRNFEDLLKRLMITEEEIRAELISELRWQKFVAQQGTDAILQDYFAKNLDMFDGRVMRARHIFLARGDGQPEAALAKITSIKQTIDSQVAQAVAKLPDNMDAAAREMARARTLEAAFADAARAKSECPSKKDGGDLSYFSRNGKMLEPFSRAAFALRLYQMSDPVATKLGYHLILPIEFKPGRQVGFDQVRPIVQDVYSERLREAVLGHYKSKTNIEIIERKKADAK